MKKLISILVGVALAAGVVNAAQDTALDGTAEVRDPVRLKVWLEANAANAESRIAALESGAVTNSTAVLTVGGLTTTGAVTIAEGALTDSKVVSADIKDGEIVNADLNASAAIALSKLGTGTLGTGVVYSNASGKVTAGSVVAPVALIGDVRFTGTITNTVWHSGVTNLMTYAYSNGLLRATTKGW